MTKEDEFFARANAPMSAPDRLKGLMDAATKHRDFADFRRSLIEQLETTDTASAVGAFITDKIDETVESESLALEEVSAWVAALLADGTLDYCRECMVNRAALLKAVENFDGKAPAVFPPETKISFFDPKAAKADAQLIKQARKARRPVSLHNDHLRYGETRLSTCRRKVAAKASSPALFCANIAWSKSILISIRRKVEGLNRRHS